MQLAFCLVVTALVAGAGCRGSPLLGTLSVSSTDKGTFVDIDASTGLIVGVRGANASRSLLAGSGGGTSLDGCAVDPASPISVTQHAPGGSIHVHRVLQCPRLLPPGYSVEVVDTFTPANRSVAWQTALGSQPLNGSSPLLPGPFTTAIRTSIVPRLPTGGTYWTSWGKGCVENDGTRSGMCASSGLWRSPLHPEPLPASETRYRLGSSKPDAGGWCPPAVADCRPFGSVDSITLPQVALLPATSASSAAGGDLGVTLALDPSERELLDVVLHVSVARTEFSRRFLRIAGGLQRRFTAHISVHAASIRSSLAFAREQWPTHFMPVNAGVADFEGLGSYSWFQGEYNKTRGDAIGFKTNWDLSGTFMPYDGLFLPYGEPSLLQWPNLGPINGGLAQYNVTYGKIDAYYRAIQAKQFHSLSYFDIGNWGTRIDLGNPGALENATVSCPGTRPNGQPAPCWEPAAVASSKYLWERLMPALLRRAFTDKFEDGPFHDWVGTTDMDPGEPNFQDLIVEQATMHLQRLSAFEGIAVDRLDYSEHFNLDADDGVSWVPHPGRNAKAWDGSYGPARSLRLSYRDTFRRVSQEAIHTRGGGKVMLMNCNSLCRIDQVEHFDGTFSEGASLNGVAWTGIAMPSILWTYGLEGQSEAQLDHYFQQHLLMNVYPSAPMPGR